MREKTRCEKKPAGESDVTEVTGREEKAVFRDKDQPTAEMMSAGVEPAAGVREAGGETTPVAGQEAEGTATGCGDRSETDERDAKIAELQDRVLRLQADFDNFRRRTRQEKEELGSWVRAGLIADLLPVIDNFERALAAEGSGEQLLAGVSMIYRQLLSVLEKNDVTVIDSDNCRFDPKCHEAVSREETGDYPDGTVMATLQKGYRLGERVLRPAMVKVACGQ